MDIQFEEDTNFAAILTQLKQHILQGHACLSLVFVYLQCESPQNYAKCGKSSSYLWKRKDGRDISGVCTQVVPPIAPMKVK